MSRSHKPPEAPFDLRVYSPGESKPRPKSTRPIPSPSPPRLYVPPAKALTPLGSGRAWEAIITLGDSRHLFKVWEEADRVWFRVSTLPALGSGQPSPMPPKKRPTP